MDGFPRTVVGGVSVSRLVAGTNWLMGFSHTSAAKDDFIRSEIRQPERMADVLEVFLRAGVDTILGPFQMPPLREAVDRTEQRVGRGMIVMTTPAFAVSADTAEKGFDRKEVAKTLEEAKKAGATFCMPHQCTTDPLLDMCSRRIRRMDELCRAIRERGMIPGLSTHAPETVVVADETGLDVETYIQIYNAMGFLMHVEVDWVHQIIHRARKPVLAIKPLAAGQLRPFQGLQFAWGTLRPCDMVCVGTMTPREAEEVIEISLSALEGRSSNLRLQETRSKASVKTRA